MIKTSKFILIIILTVLFNLQERFSIKSSFSILANNNSLVLHIILYEA